MKNSRQSIFVTLGIIIVSAVVLILSVHSAYTYSATKDAITQEMRHDSKTSIVSLQKNIAGLIESYAFNEYNNIVQTEVESRGNFAIVIEDYHMGKIIGEKSLISGKIRDQKWNIIDYDPKNSEQNRLLKNSYHSDRSDIISSSGELLGSVTFYNTDDVMNTKLNSILVERLIDTVAISLVLIIILFIAIRHFILKPLTDIAVTISQSDEYGIPLQEIKSQKYKETDKLANSVNNMIDTIKSSRLELLQQQEQLEHSAKHDPLTSLPNRFLFDELIKSAIHRSNRHKKILALLYIDLDGFKEVNDTYGHDAGDFVLTTIAKRMQEVIRQEDIIARLGGDEFVIAISNLDGTDELTPLLQRLLHDIIQSIDYAHKGKIIELHVSASIGVSFYSLNNAVEPETLLHQADISMYKAKNSGKNQYCFFES